LCNVVADGILYHPTGSLNRLREIKKYATSFF
jgi:hypothetical protein